MVFINIIQPPLTVFLVPRFLESIFIATLLLISFLAKVGEMHTEMMQTASKVLQLTFARGTLTSLSSPFSHQIKELHPCLLVGVDKDTYRRLSPEIQIATAENPCPVSALDCMVMESLAALGELLSKIK